MTRRKPPKVSLPPVNLREATQIAESALRRFATMGYTAGKGPTPERLLKANGNAAVGRFHEVAEISKGDKFELVTVEKNHVVIADDPLTILFKKRLLDHTDAADNLALYSAGQRYRQAWRDAGFDKLANIDFERVSASTNAGLFSSEFAADAFKLLKRMRGAIHLHYVPAVVGVVLEDRDLVDVGRQISAYKAPKQAAAVARTDLVRGLRQIAIELGLIQPPAPLVENIPEEISQSS